MEPQKFQDLRQTRQLYLDKTIEGVGSIKVYGKPDVEKIMKVLLQSEAILNG